MSNLLQDLRYGLRMLRKTPGFTITALLALILGIASTTAIFSVVEGVLLRPLPYPDAEHLVSISQSVRSTGISRTASSAPTYLDWAAQNTVFSHMAAARGMQANLAEGDRPERVRVTMTTAGMFPLFGVNPLLGRALQPSDERPGNDKVVVLSHGLWQRRFGAERSIVGHDINLNGQPHTVVGVMPPNYSPDGYGELWLPSPWGVPSHPLRQQEDPRQRRNSNYLDVFARLKPGVTLEQARAEMNGIMMRLEKQYPSELDDAGVVLNRLHDEMVSDIRPILFVLLAAVAFLLLIACVNVANLQLARAATRAREISIRAALGASRMRLIRQLLTESVLLALVGGALGVLLAAWAIPLLLSLSPSGIRNFTEISLNRQVLGFSILASVVTGIAFGLGPAFHAASARPGEALGEGDRGSTGRHSRGRSILIAVEVGLSLVLLIGAGLTVRSFSKLTRVDPGFDAERLLIFDAGPSAADSDRQNAFYQQVVQRLQTLPGVQRAGAVSRLPLSGGNPSRSFNLPGREQEYNADIRVCTPEYFQALGIPLRKGRSFTDHDVKGSLLVAVINEALAKSVFPGEDPIGRTITNFGPASETLQIVGIVGSVRHVALESAPQSEIYQPLGQATGPRMSFAVKTAAPNPLSLIPAAQNAVSQVDKNVALGNVRTMQDAIANSVVKRKFTMMLLSIFAGLAVALAAIGLYGVMSYSVSQRTREIGIRMAVGAQRIDVLKLIVRQGMLVTGLGIIAGLCASFALTRLMATLLYGVSATDSITFVALSALLLFVALLACWLPARRASGVDPMVALRAE